MGPSSYELADFNLCTAQPNAARRRKKKEAEKFILILRDRDFRISFH